MIKAIIQRPLAAFLIAALVAASGAISALMLPIKLQPNVSMPFLMVSAYVDKDTALDSMEKDITIPLESLASSHDIVKDVSATTTTKSVNMEVMLKDTAKPNQIDKLKEELNQKLNAVPMKLDHKDVRQFSASDQVIMMIALHSKEPDQEQLRKVWKEQLIPELRDLPGVSKVEHSFDNYKESFIFEFKADKIQSLQQASDRVSELRSGFASQLLGTLEYGGSSFRVRSEATITTIDELLHYRFSTGERLSDVADVKRDMPANHSYTMFNGEQYYEVNVFATDAASEVKISEKVRAVISKLHADQTAQWDYLFAWDASNFIGTAVNELVVNILIGAAIAAVILLVVFRSIRTTIIIGISMPICILTTLLSMGIFGYSINIITLMGIGLGTGMIVDACIVVIENIHRKIQDGLSRMEAVVDGTKEVFTPVLSSILTTVAVFLPISFMDGMIGVFMKQLGLTVTVSLFASLAVALTIIPILSNKLLKQPKEIEVKKSRLLDAYEKTLSYVLRRRWRTLGVFTLVLIVSLYALIVFVPKNYIPNVSDRSLFINVEVDEKIDFETNQSMMTSAAEQMLVIDGVKEVFYWGNDQSTSSGTFIVLFEDRADMEQSDEEMKAQIGETIDRTIPYSFLSMGEGQGDTSGQMSISLTASSMDELIRSLPPIREELALISGVTGTKAALTEGSKEWVVQFSREQLAYHSISREEVERYLDLVLNGASDIDVNVDGETTKASIEFPTVYRQSSDGLYQLPIRSLQNLTLEDVSTLEQEESEANRVRKNGRYEMNVSIYFDPAMRERVIEQVGQFVKVYPSDVLLALSGTQQQQAEGFEKLLIAVGVSFAAVFMILTIQFNRFRLPFLIMLSLPYAMIGVALGFLISGRDFDIMAMIGIVMLVGIVVNNAIVLIDFINNHRKDYPDVISAVIEGAKLRVRPIMTTTLTTIGGLIPMFIGGSEASSFQTPIATAVIFGLAFSTFVSMILVPVLYYMFEGGQERKQLRMERKTGREAAKASKAANA